METFSVLLAICAGNSPVTDEFPAQGPVTQSFDVFFALRLNIREAGDLRRHHAHYDVIVTCVWNEGNREQDYLQKQGEQYYWFIISEKNQCI